MTLESLLASPLVTAIPPAVAGAYIALLRFRLAVKRLELGRCPKCDKPEQPDLPILAPMLLLLISIGSGMMAWARPSIAVARAAGSEQRTPGQRPPAKSCTGGESCGRSCSCVRGECQCAAEERNRRKVALIPFTSSSPPAWQDTSIQAFADRDPDITR